MASTGIQQEMNNVKYTQEDLDREIQGKRAVANHLNNTKYNLATEQKKTQQLYNMIMKQLVLKFQLNIMLLNLHIQIRREKKLNAGEVLTENMLVSENGVCLQQKKI